MKRMFFSKLLMGALLVAAIGTVVSCKDYDDDINNLQAQIDRRATIAQLETLQGQLNNSIVAAQKTADEALELAQEAATVAQLDAVVDSINKASADAAQKIAASIKAAADAAAAAQKAADAAAADAAAAAATGETAQKTAEDAQKSADDAQKSADDAQKSADDAQKSADDAKTAAGNAQKTADGAAADAAAAQKAAETAAQLARQAQEAISNIKVPDITGLQNEEQVKALIAQYAQAKGEYVLASELKKQLDDIKKDIQNLADNEEFKALQKKVDSYALVIGKLYTAVTSIELIESYSGTRHTLQGGTLGYYGKSINVTMTHGMIGETSVFGDKEDGEHTASPLANYIKGADIKDPKGIVVRVNPVNADITSANILLINSMGESLADYVKVGTPKKFDKLLTRADNIDTGLWELPLEVAPGVTEDDFNKKVRTADGDSILYAVAINNTLGDTLGTNRYVVSSYDLTVGYKAYQPANHFTFIVKNSVAVTSVEKIHNRWDATSGQIRGESGSNPSTANPEMAWITPTASVAVPVPVPASKHMQKDQAAGSAVWTLPAEVGFNEDRHGQPLFIVSEDKPFTVSKLMAYQANGTETAIDSFYVTLDYKNAIESAASEGNAWKAYRYEGLNTMKAADEDLSIVIKSGYNANPDIIGFRVWAVNRDGSLVDPDGRAFYVLVTDAATDNALSATVTATKSGNTVASTPMDITGKLNGAYTYRMKINTATKVVDTTPAAVKADLKYFAFNFIKGAATTTVSTLSGEEAVIPVVANATALTITPQNMENLVDGATYVFTLTGYENVGGTDVPRTITTITLQKTMPTAAKTLQFLPDKEVIAGSGKFMLYLIPNKGNAWARPWATNFADETTAVYQATEGNYVDNAYIDLNNVFYNLNNDKSLQFVFKSSLRNTANTADIDLFNAATDWGIIYNSPGNDSRHYALDVDARYINGVTEHDVEVSTIYDNVSTTLKADGTVSKYAKKYLVKSSQDLKAVYACWHHASTFDWGYANKTYKQPKIQWTVGGADKTTALSDISNTAAYYSSMFGKDLKTLVDNAYLILPSTPSIQLNTKADGTGQKNPYFVPSISTTAITYTQTSAAPNADHTEYLIFTLKDVYGHDVRLSLPVLVQRP